MAAGLRTLGCAALFASLCTPANASVLVERQTSAACVVGGTFQVELRATAIPPAQVRSFVLEELLPEGWTVLPESVEGPTVAEIIPADDGRVRIVWAILGDSRTCVLGEGGPCGASEIHFRFAARASSSSPRQFSGVVNYSLLATPSAGGSSAVVDRAPGTPAACEDAILATRRVLSSCRPGELLSVAIDVATTGARPVGRIDLVEYFPAGWVVDDVMLPEPLGTWDDEQANIAWRVSTVGSGSFLYHLRTPAQPPRTAVFGEGLLGDVATVVGHTPDGVVTVPIAPAAGPPVVCSPAPTPTLPPGVECVGPGEPGQCDPQFETCVGFRCTCVGDCNLDGGVDFGELSLLRGLLGRSPAALEACPAADFDGDRRFRTIEMTKALRNLERDCPRNVR